MYPSHLLGLVVWTFLTYLSVSFGRPLHSLDQITDVLTGLSIKEDVVQPRQAPPVVEIDCTSTSSGGDIEDICNMDCYAILCLKKPSTLTRNSNGKRHNRQMSGANVTPFSGNSLALASRGVTRLNDSTISAEEFPFAATDQGGSGNPNNDNTPQIQWAVVGGVERVAQLRQGGRLNAEFDRAQVNNGEDFQIRFKSNAEFCVALNKDPPDTSVCQNSNPKPDSPLVRVFYRSTPATTYVQFLPARPGVGIYKDILG
ncbi:uncharacterized protein Z518_01764 [Rhinocladiella mackenziei CBS 650.93]|uniref:Deoxyribonuclease NucA/NucB domain-containing protein n=1 Tax=Rhinocladiella mackenziei CBS 650.93 TaxID=1442369 RepID=A0A0D2JMI3_9EURO|nr:uncharacterized protein Z518_01764 [Rhinocladiella mackenziei CBS 650.93]KIX10680.1 hypothetical protein Z518_01764 [Rhinocladiella mackenziei CBS 650.93]